jgi:anti-sigma-K factor RskA
VDYAKPERADALAADYVTGTLRGAARRRFETLLGSHPRLRSAVAAWEARLMPMTAVVEPVAPSSRVWTGIQQRVGQAAAAAAAPPQWKTFSWWQALTGFASVAALALAVVLAVPRPAQPPIVVVLAPSGAEGEPLAAQARFVASVSADGRGLVLRPVDAMQVRADRALELWAVPAQGAPRSLGLVDQAKGATLLRAQLLQDTAAFAVSLEPQGGSPTGAPTGPVISVGKLGA